MNLDPRTEIQRLEKLEYGEKVEFTVRVVCVVAGNFMLVDYLDSQFFWVWTLFYILSHSIYFLFLRSRRVSANNLDVDIASIMFIFVLISFLWMPTFMMLQNDQTLVITGSYLAGATLVFLVRRGDASLLMLTGQIIVVGFFGAVILTGQVLAASTWIEKAGILTAGSALVGYFIQAIRVSSKQRLEAISAAIKSSQEQKLTAIGQLAGGVAHDFNNNLTVIMGNLELAQILEDGKERDQCLEEAILSSQQATRTVQQLLLYAREKPPELDILNAVSLVSELIPLTRKLIPANVATEISCAKKDLEICADKGQILTALINLISNSVDAMKEGGTLSISVVSSNFDTIQRLRSGTHLQPGNYAEFIVKDTGSGIPEEYLDRVFDPFFTKKPIGKGTGLGLSTVQGVASELNGGVDIFSSQKGTAMSIYVPIVNISADASHLWPPSTHAR